MGSGTFSAADYRAFSHTTRGKTTDDIYSSRSIHESLNPYKVTMRESRDSEDNPQATPVIVALDVTGSMGVLADVIARDGLGVLFTTLLDQKPITNPHVMFMAVGDANYDSAPLQVSQFEADNRIVEQLTNIFIEHGGGGNRFESYNLPWYFAANHTVHDSLIKRGKRGYLFTVGDEEAPGDLTVDQIKRFIGDTPEHLGSSADMLSDAQRMYDVFHIMIGEGSHAKAHPKPVRDSWTALLGQRAMWLSDHKQLAQTIVSAVEVAEGRDAAAVSSKWSSKAVFEAVKSLPKSTRPQLVAPTA